MTHLDVITKNKQGQWVNEVEGATDLSRSFSSRAEAISAARDFVQQHGSLHSVEEATPSGVITDAAEGGERDQREEDEEADHLLHGEDLPDPPIEP